MIPPLPYVEEPNRTTPSIRVVIVTNRRANPSASISSLASFTRPNHRINQSHESIASIPSTSRAPD